MWGLRLQQQNSRNPEVLGRESMESGFGPGRESKEELRHTPNSTTTGSPHTDLVSTSNQPSHDSFMMLASSFVVCRAGSVCRLPSAVPLPCCLMCVCRCMSDPSSASGAPQQNPSRACPRRASVECFSPRRAVALLLPLRVWVLSCLRVSLVCLESRVCLRTLHSRSRA